MIYPVTKDRNLSTFDFYSFELVRLDKSDGSGAQQTGTMTTNVFCLHCHASSLQTSAIYRNIMEQLVFLPSIPLLMHTPMRPVNIKRENRPFVLLPLYNFSFLIDDEKDCSSRCHHYLPERELLIKLIKKLKMQKKDG